MSVSLNELSSSDVRQLQVLGAIITLTDGDPDLETSLRPLSAELRVTDRDDVIRADVESLHEANLVTYSPRFGGEFTTRATGPGLDRWAEFDDARSKPSTRRIPLRDAYLRWLYEEIEDHGTSPTRKSYLETRPIFLGIEYDQEDISKVGEWLKDAGFIAGDGSWGDHSPLHPSLTAKGIYTVENNRSVSDPSPASQSSAIYNSTFNAPANVSQGSTNVHQNLTVQTWHEQAARVIDAIDQALPTFELALRPEIAAEMDTVRAELAGEARVSKVRDAFHSLIGTFGKATAGGLGGLFVAQLTTLLSSLTA